MEHHVEGQPVFCTDYGGQCTRAALVNAIHAVVGKEEAHDMLMRDFPPVRRLKKGHLWLQDEIRTFKLQEVENPLKDDFEKWLASVLGSESVFLVRLIGSD